MSRCSKLISTLILSCSFFSLFISKEGVACSVFQQTSRQAKSAFAWHTATAVKRYAHERYDDQVLPNYALIFSKQPADVRSDLEFKDQFADFVPAGSNVIAGGYSEKQRRGYLLIHSQRPISRQSGVTKLDLTADAKSGQKSLLLALTLSQPILDWAIAAGFLFTPIDWKQDTLLRDDHSQRRFSFIAQFYTEEARDTYVRRSRVFFESLLSSSQNGAQFTVESLDSTPSMGSAPFAIIRIRNETLLKIALGNVALFDPQLIFKNADQL